ncbi:MAG: hypothetical protein R3F59_00240 [Myxococcota bacterium]
MGEAAISQGVSYRLHKAASDGETIVGAYGGHPRGIRSHQWPRCRVCGHPMCHMAQIDAGPWLDLQGFARMSVFICHAQGGRCEDWDPWKGANKVLLHRVQDDNLYDGPPTVRVYRRVKLGISPRVDEGALIREARERGQSSRTVLANVKYDKLGGWPAWLHPEDPPASPAGRGPMRHVLQMTTEVVTFDITRGGMAWVFVDPWDDTEDAARMLWQGG